MLKVLFVILISSMGDLAIIGETITGEITFSQKNPSPIDMDPQI
jgi:hypothetical protein